MGLFDSILGQASQALTHGLNTEGGAAPHAGLLEAVMGLVQGAGGLQGLIAQFREKGLGDIVASWIGPGQNLPISAEQIQSVLGSEQVQAIAQRLGLSTGDAASGLATLLPQVIDHLTPSGEVPHGDLLGQGLALLRGLGKSA